MSCRRLLCRDGGRCVTVWQDRSSRDDHDDVPLENHYQFHVGDIVVVARSQLRSFAPTGDHASMMLWR